MVKVFISYCRADIDAANRLYEKLKEEKSVEPWFDKENLLPGLKWKPAIRKAIRESDFFIALISSRSTSKRGYVHSELRMAIEILKEFPEDHIFLIPARLDDCDMPDEDLREINYVDLFKDWDEGMRGIISVIKHKVGSMPSVGRSPASGYEYRVGITDLDIGISNIQNIAQRLNSIQNYFNFSCPTLPNLAHAVKLFDNTPNLDVHLIPHSFYAEHPYLAVDLVACMTKYPLAFREGNEIQYDYFSGPGERDNRFMFISTYELYDFTKKAGCSFEKGIVYLVVSQIVAYFTDLGYHDETRGCVMDFCENRDDLIKGLKQPRFCNRCKTGIRNPGLGSSLDALLADNLRF